MADNSGEQKKKTSKAMASRIQLNRRYLTPAVITYSIDRTLYESDLALEISHKATVEKVDPSSKNWT